MKFASTRAGKAVMPLAALIIFFLPLGPLAAQEPARSIQHTFGGQFIFWMGAVALVVLFGRQIFKEQLNERRTLRRLIREIGPYFPEFDIDSIKRWVALCAPHVWAGWTSGELRGIDDFITDNFKGEWDALMADIQENDHRVQSQLFAVLKVPPLGLYMVGPGPAPQDVELMLRLEQKAIYVVRNAQGKVIEGSESVQQIHHFWTLRHDGRSLRLNRVWLAERDMTNLAKLPMPPVVTEWVQLSDSKPNTDS